ncbi:MAG: organomercurial lyase [Nevskiales bacterium]
MQAEILQKLLPLFPALDREAQRISLALYRLLSGGQPVSAAQLAAAVDLDEPGVTRALEQWPGVFLDNQKRVVGYWGLALSKMAHQFRLNGRLLYTWCAWDSLFIPQLLGEAVQIESVCPVTRKAIRLTVRPQGVEDVQPGTAVISLMLPSDDSIMQDIVTRFCHYVHFFQSERAAERWTTANPSTVIVGIQDAYDLGREKNAAQYPDVLVAGGSKEPLTGGVR